MTCLVEFTYDAEHREFVFRHLKEGGIADMGVKIEGAWLAAQTGVAYVMVKAKNSLELYQACARWADYGKLKITPVVSVTDI